MDENYRTTWTSLWLPLNFLLPLHCPETFILSVYLLHFHISSWHQAWPPLLWSKINSNLFISLPWIIKRKSVRNFNSNNQLNHFTLKDNRFEDQHFQSDCFLKMCPFLSAYFNFSSGTNVQPINALPFYRSKKCFVLVQIFKPAPKN